MKPQIIRYIEIDNPQEQLRIEVSLFNDGTVQLEKEYYSVYAQPFPGIRLTQDDLLTILVLFQQLGE